MATLQFNILTAVLKYFTVPIPETLGTETITIKIMRRVDSFTWNFSTLTFENVTPVNTGSMLYISDSIWQSLFTPPTDGEYVAYIYDADNQLAHYVVFTAAGYVPAVPAVSLPGDLTSLADVKESLGITDTDSDNLLTRLITAASKWMEKQCKRVFASATYTEYYNGTGNASICLKQYPVISVTSLHDDTDRAYTADYLIASTDYIIEETSGIITLDGLCFNYGLKNIKVIYVAGYAIIPQDLAQACIDLVSLKFNNQGKDGITAERMGSYSVNYSEAEIPPAIKIVLDKYVKKGVH